MSELNRRIISLENKMNKDNSNDMILRKLENIENQILELSKQFDNSKIQRNEFENILSNNEKNKKIIGENNEYIPHIDTSNMRMKSGGVEGGGRSTSNTKK